LPPQFANALGGERHEIARATIGESDAARRAGRGRFSFAAIPTTLAYRESRQIDSARPALGSSSAARVRRSRIETSA
jgi:hypothetical protein